MRLSTNELRVKDNNKRVRGVCVCVCVASAAGTSTSFFLWNFIFPFDGYDHDLASCAVFRILALASSGLRVNRCAVTCMCDGDFLFRAGSLRLRAREIPSETFWMTTMSSVHAFHPHSYSGNGPPKKYANNATRCSSSSILVPFYWWLFVFTLFNWIKSTSALDTVRGILSKTFKAPCNQHPSLHCSIETENS